MTESQFWVSYLFLHVIDDLNQSTPVCFVFLFCVNTLHGGGHHKKSFCFICLCICIMRVLPPWRRAKGRLSRNWLVQLWVTTLLELLGNNHRHRHHRRVHRYHHQVYIDCKHILIQSQDTQGTYLILVTTATSSSGVLFSSRCPFSPENAKFGLFVPVWLYCRNFMPSLVPF